MFLFFIVGNFFLGHSFILIISVFLWFCVELPYRKKKKLFGYRQQKVASF